MRPGVKRVKSAADRAARRPAGWLAAVGVALLAGCSPSPAERVLVVTNGASPVSRAIGDYYARRREIPAENHFEVDVPLRDPELGDADDEVMSRADYVARIRDPIGAFLEERGWTDRIRMIVVAKGVPLRVRGLRPVQETWLKDASGASVDAELALLGSDLDGRAGVASTPNPYFDSPLSFDRFRAAHPEAPLHYLVTRLTGYQNERDPETGIPADVRRLIDSAQAVVDGKAAGPPVWIVDESASDEPGRAAGDGALLRPAAAALQALGARVLHDTGKPMASDAENVQADASWGSNDGGGPGEPFYGEIDGLRYPGRFAPRAVAVDFVSSSARSFHWPPHYGQSLLADLLRLGVAGAAGHVDEPTLAGVARPHILFWHYAQGAPAAEAFYRSIPYLGWQNVWVGDPLMRLPEAQWAESDGDRDGDGIPDDSDDCVAHPDPEQRDTDGDGFGNECDPDIDGDGIVTTSWGRTTPVSQRGDVEWIALAAREGVYDENLDLDGNGRVDAVDVARATLWLFLPPGPSARGSTLASR